MTTPTKLSKATEGHQKAGCTTSPVSRATALSTPSGGTPPSKRERPQPSGKIGSFDVELWKQVGFRFRHQAQYPGHFLWWGRASFDGKSFTIMLSVHEKTDDEEARVACIGAVGSSATRDHENHAVSQHDAVRWFSRVSPEFASRWSSLPSESR